MHSNELTVEAHHLLQRAYAEGKLDGIAVGRVALETLASHVPKSITKAWLVSEIERQLAIVRQTEATVNEYLTVGEDNAVGEN